MKKAKGELINEIIDTLMHGVNEAVDWFNDPQAYDRKLRGYLSQDEWNRLFGDQKKKLILRRLKKKKWVEARQVGNTVTYLLSHDILAEHLKQSMRTTASKIHSGELLIAFDFPEAAGRARRDWRRLLKGVGFKQVQLSVWSTVKAVEEQVLQLVRLLRIQKWVKVYRCYELR
ncbi:MAG: hypothetical protein UY76_C0002G0018 [Candidatus Uhrbacteria bacterium GW2011_GWA2_52_8d]|uniref:Transcriptional repressor PaaX-like central Cas2-like domain-containing protein n=1 Tax=Candidatus Uhrbacteria bacterium GW2011_GWA2_52_8d TaxID=1618979 RepID=A0A0G2ALD9_9BACT|nr:MAG: hypothetical protein UY76_C0002G0018 [Candidatus Uhrbacteria bacterium GW2011_GWA2_52_8d]